MLNKLGIFLILSLILIFGCIAPSPITEQKSVCLFNTPFSCSKETPQVYDKDGSTYLSVTLNNLFGKNVKIHKIACSTTSIDDISKDLATTEENMIILGGNSTYNPIPCFDKNGNQLHLKPNSEFKGAILVWYNFENDQEGTRIASATLITPVLPSLK